MSKESFTITPNRRLARYLQNQSYSKNIKSGVTAWQTEKILPLTAWLINFWQECKDSRILLNSHQERLLWRKIIEKTLGKDFNTIVDTVISAHEIVINWQLDSISWSDYETEDVKVFKKLHRKFIKHCEEHNLIVACQLPSLLPTYLQNQDFELNFVDFDEYYPQLQNLIDHLQKSGIKVVHSNSNSCKGSLHKKISFNRQYDEINAIASWAKKLVTLNQKVTVGVVASNLTEIRSEVIRVFSEVFGDIKNINISVGVIFSSLPIISDALVLLTMREPFSLKMVNKLLLTPYIGGAESEKSSRSLFDYQLNQLEQSQFNLSGIEFLAKKYDKDIPVLVDLLQKSRDLLISIRNKRLGNSEWAQLFVEILTTFGWPGENNLTADETAAVNRFTELLQEFAASSKILGKKSFNEAMQDLIDMAEHTIFQPEQEKDKSINILGVLEASGVNFDYLWVMGVDQDRWPMAPNPTPFIPIKIQKKLGLPHASAERELYFCERLFNRFKCSAKEVIFSYVKLQEDRTVAASSLLADIPEVLVDELDLIELVSPDQKIYYSRKMEAVVDDNTLTLMPEEKIHGGSRLIEMQSLCPFRAFAEFRLAAKEFKRVEPGVSKLKRGVLIHAALERFWQEVKTHQNLCLLEQSSLQGLVSKSVNYALDQGNLSQQLYKLEYQCLMRLLISWLEIEKNRPPFEVIATEKTVLTSLGPVQIKLRIDRIDKLSNGDLLLIDYKSGRSLPAIFDWFGKRPKNPQLPLYCVAIAEKCSFAFAQINIESIKFRDVSFDELSFGLRTTEEESFKNSINWEELLGYWQEVLVGLANDFVSGNVQPDPFSIQVCKQCDFGILCRYKNV